MPAAPLRRMPATALSQAPTGELSRLAAGAVSPGAPSKFARGIAASRPRAADFAKLYREIRCPALFK
jgi:hypothetical protein